MVSLPAEWTKKFGVIKGDSLDIEEINKDLIISVDKEVKIQSVEFNAKGLDSKHLKRYVREIYKMGYDEIKIYYDGKNTISELQDYISKVLMGYEIVEQHPSSIVIKCISKVLDNEFETILRRAFLVTMELSNEILNRIKVSDFKSLKNVSVLEETNDKLTNFCQRVLNKNGYKMYVKTHFMYTLVWQLEKIADQYNYMCKYLIDNSDIKLDKDVLNVFERTSNLFKEFYELFYNYSKEKLMSFTKNSKKLIVDLMELQSNSKAKQDYVLAHLSVISTKIANLTGPVIGIMI